MRVLVSTGEQLQPEDITTVCMHCKKVLKPSTTYGEDSPHVSHGICQKCLQEFYPEFYKRKYGSPKEHIVSVLLALSHGMQPHYPHKRYLAIP